MTDPIEAAGDDYKPIQDENYHIISVATRGFVDRIRREIRHDVDSHAHRWIGGSSVVYPLINLIDYQSNRIDSDRTKLTERDTKIASLEAEIERLRTTGKAMVLLVEDYEAKTCKVIRAAITIGKDDWRAEAKERELAMHKMFDFLDTFRAALSREVK